MSTWEWILRINFSSAFLSLSLPPPRCGLIFRLALPVSLNIFKTRTFRTQHKMKCNLGHPAQVFAHLWMQTLAMGPTKCIPQDKGLIAEKRLLDPPRLNDNIQKTWHLRTTDTAPPSNVVKETCVIILCYAMMDPYSSLVQEVRFLTLENRRYIPLICYEMGFSPQP